jgi:hypothetical protein
MKITKTRSSKKHLSGLRLPRSLRLINFTLAFALVGTLLLLFTSAAPVPGFYGSIEQDQVNRINSTRAAYGKGSLQHIECLNTVAERWAEYMAKNDFPDGPDPGTAPDNIAHNPNLASDVDRHCGSQWAILGENVGVGYSSQSIYDAFMASPAHKDNILGGYFGDTGVGAYWHTDGSLYITQVFAGCGNCSGSWNTNASLPADPKAPVPKARRLYMDANGKGYVLDSWGHVWPIGGAPLSSGDKWYNWDIARAMTVKPDLSAAVIMDGWGGTHRIGNAPALGSAGYWRGWDIARDLIVTDWATGSGLQLDGWGGVHKFGSNPPANVTGGAYWQGWDIARRVAVAPGGGYTLAGWGSVHPFGQAPKITKGPYWKNWDIARDLEISPDGSRGYVLDGWGGIHALTISGKPASPAASGGPYWRGQDVAVDMVITDWSVPKGYVLDVKGGVHPFGGAPAASGGPYWP